MSDEIDMNKQNIVDNTEQSKIIDNTSEVLNNQSTPEYKKIENNKIPTSPTTKEMNYLGENKQSDISGVDYSTAYYNANKALDKDEFDKNKEFINLNPSDKDGFNKRLDDTKKELQGTSLKEKISKTREILGDNSTYETILRQIENRIANRTSDNNDDAIVTRIYSLAKVDTSHKEKEKEKEKTPETPEIPKEKKEDKLISAGDTATTISENEIDNPDIEEKHITMQEYDNRGQLTDEGVTWGEVALGDFGDNIKKVKNKQADINKTRDEALGDYSKTEDSKNAKNSKSEYQKEKETRKRLKKVLGLQNERKRLEKMLENTPPIKEYINGRWVDNGKRPKIFNKIKDDIDKIDSELNTDYSDLKDYTIDDLKNNIKDNFKEKNDALGTMLKMNAKFKGNENKIKFAALSHSEYLVNDLAKKGLISPKQQEEMIKDIKDYKELKKPLNIQVAKMTFLIVDAFRKTIMNIARAMPRTQYSANLGEMETPAIESIINTAISNTQDAIHQAQTNVLDVGKEKQFKEMELQLKWAENQWLKDQKAYTAYYDNILKKNEYFYDQLNEKFKVGVERLKQKLPYEIVHWIGDEIAHMSDEEARKFVKGLLGKRATSAEAEGFFKMLIGLTPLEETKLRNIFNFYSEPEVENE